MFKSEARNVDETECIVPEPLNDFMGMKVNDPATF
jgi:hypothetical protein